MTPLKAGTATLTLKTADGSKSASCTVTVTAPISVTGVSLNTTTLNIALGADIVYLQATVAPSNATNKFVTWVATPAGIVTVDSGGGITTVNVGTAIVSATTFDGNKTATCLVTVTPTVHVSSISISPPTLSLAVGGFSGSLHASFSPANSTNQNATWTSSDPSIASIGYYYHDTYSGGSYAYINPVSAGTATITATSVDGGKTATATVTVTAPVAVTGISLSQTSISTYVGGYAYLNAYITPSNATNQNMQWTTSDSTVESFN